MKLPRFVNGIVCLLALAACAAPPVTQTSPATDNSAGAPVSQVRAPEMGVFPLGPHGQSCQDWSILFCGEGKVGSVAEATSLVSFPVRIPQFGSPTSVAVLAGYPMIGFAYNLTSLGRVRVAESPAKLSALDFQTRMVDSELGVESQSARTTVRGGIPAVLAGKGLTRLLWIENSVQFDIGAESASRDQIRELAEHF